MKIDISHISKVNGASLDVSVNETLAELEKTVDGFVFTNPVNFEGKLVNAGDVLNLSGRVSVNFASKCHRCLKDLENRMTIPVKENFISSEKATDEESYTYEGNYLTIDKALKDNIILNLPIRQLCNDECKGLCKSCGCDLNVSGCECMEDTINPQMEALKNFFKT